jgi:hypothetical protein
MLLIVPKDRQMTQQEKLHIEIRNLLFGSTPNIDFLMCDLAAEILTPWMLEKIADEVLIRNGLTK